MSFKKIQRFIYIQVLGFGGFFRFVFVFFFKFLTNLFLQNLLRHQNFGKWVLNENTKMNFFSLESDFVDLKIYYKQCILSIFKNSNYLIWIVN